MKTSKINFIPSMGKLMPMLCLATAMSLGFASCSNDDPEEPTPEPDPAVVVDYKSVLPGHWAVTGLDEDRSESIGINSNGTGTISFQAMWIQNESDDSYWGVLAFGTYTLSDNKITATFTNVMAHDNHDNAATYLGFTDEKSKTVTYTILSCDGKKLVLRDEERGTRTYEKYADVK